MARAIRIAVRRGCRYRAPRRGLPARHVVVVGVRRGITAKGQQPTVSLAETTRGGRRKIGDTFTTFLQFRDGAWRIGPGYEPVA